MLAKLVAIQRAHDWTDAEMATRLAVARSTYTMIKNGRLPLSARVQMAAARAFPELLGELLGQVSNPSRAEVA